MNVFERLSDDLSYVSFLYRSKEAVKWVRRDMRRRMVDFSLLTIFVLTTIVLVSPTSAAPSVDFSWNPSGDLFAGQEVTFTAIVNGVTESEIISYNWNFGDGSTASGQTVTHQLSKGNNTITFTLKRKASADDSNDTFAVWANSTTDALAISATGMIINGSLHSNNDISITGTDHIVNGKIEYISNYNAPEEIPHEKALAPGDFPVAYDISEYKPNGTKALEARKEGKYHEIKTTADIPAGVFDGLYYATIDVTIPGNYRSGIFTLVAEGKIHVSGSNDNFTAYIDDLLFFSNSSSCPPDDPAFHISKSNSKFLGNVYVPNGQLKISGANNAVVGSLYGDSIQLATSGAGMNSITPIVKNINCELLNGKPGLGINVESSYIGEIVPVEVTFAVTQNVSTMLAVDGYEIWEKDLISSIENISWIPMSSGRHEITTHLYCLNGMECDNSTVSIPIYIKKVGTVPNTWIDEYGYSHYWEETP